MYTPVVFSDGIIARFHSLLFFVMMNGGASSSPTLVKSINFSSTKHFEHVKQNNGTVNRENDVAVAVHPHRSESMEQDAIDTDKRVGLHSVLHSTHDEGIDRH